MAKGLFVLAQRENVETVGNTRLAIDPGLLLTGQIFAEGVPTDEMGLLLFQTSEAAESLAAYAESQYVSAMFRDAKHYLEHLEWYLEHGYRFAIVDRTGPPSTGHYAYITALIDLAKSELSS